MSETARLADHFKLTSVCLNCSDMSVCLWDYQAPEDALLMRYDHHTVSCLFESLLIYLICFTGVSLIARALLRRIAAYPSGGNF